MRTSMLPVFFSLFAALPLNAGVVERDFLTPGDGLLTYDDVNRREWLDLTYTQGMKLSAIQSQMEAGGTFEGFEFATLEDIEPLALSAEVQWQDTERVLDPLAIDPTLLSRSQARPPISRPLAKPINSAFEVKELFDLLGNVLTVEITETFIPIPFFNIPLTFPVGNSSISRTDFFHYSFGQVADEIVDEEPRFNETSVTVFFYNSESPTRGPLSGELLESQGTNDGFGGIAMGQPEWLDGVPLANNDTGPFWLYRTASIPEPASIILMITGAVFVFSLSRHR